MSDFYINPYNFIPYDRSTNVLRGDNGVSEELLTGEIRCSLTVKTPLAIPDAGARFPSQFYEREIKKKDSQSETDHHYIYPFMTAGGVPIIPGSEIRGMIRNIYETITNSCFSIINCNTLSQRNRNPLPYAGLLQWNKEENGWRLYDATVKNKLTEKELENLRKDYDRNGEIYVVREWNLFPSVEKKWKPKGYTNKKVFLCSEDFLEVTEEEVDTLKEILRFYREYRGNDHSKQFEKVTPKKDGEFYPVYFNDSGDKVILAPAQISRKIFDHTVEDLLEKTGHAPCKQTNNLCPACRLFGSVMKDGAVSSRLRFSDAAGCGITPYPAGMEKEEDVPMLKELSSPKLTSIEFYSLPENNTRFKDRFKWSYDDKGIILRGRKVYLHNPKAELADGADPREAVFCVKNRTEDITNRNSSMQLVTKGRFDFSVYFDGITENELKTLVWALTLGDADGTTSRFHKLGHGRPLGLGSVKLTVREIAKRITDGTAYRIETQEVKAGYFDGFRLPVEGTDTLTALLAVSDFNYAEIRNVDYPVGENVNSRNERTRKNTMQWFVLNHGGLGKKSDTFKYVLRPLVKDGIVTQAKDLALPFLPEKNNGAAPKHSYRSPQRNAGNKKYR